MNLMRFVLLVIITLFSSVVLAKDIAVLLPVSGSLTPDEKMELRQVVVSNLAQFYEIRSGDEVDIVVQRVFQEESKKTDCDEMNCYRRIAAEYHAQIIISIRVNQTGTDQYIVTKNIYDVVTGEVVSSKKDCSKCSFDEIRDMAVSLVKR